ncbi:MAG TPA: hypothetical protein PLH70_09140 [Bacteroidales bacterium]|nr:hypothetical protein [Bacteroidales bacterium]HPB57867.1 hypothetical protein [Bacteroidales bacterium]HQB75950.1 hypothetical protein [Bacteroidales bacterium]HQQ20951.1 hypothetical protein [Bacteroidales bacterium]
MKLEKKTCNNCLLDDSIEGVVLDHNGVCNYCNAYKPIVPYGESHLLKILQKAKNKKRTYDALVPLSGGKDSTYVLYLAVKKYNLRVLTYTYDNGFMSDFAKQNIQTSVAKCKVDHIWVKHNEELIHNLYRTVLKLSGEICGVCGIGIERSMLKISEAYKTPLILLGHTASEQNSFTSENIYDQDRLKAILKKDKKISNSMIDRFLIYPKLNFISSYLYTKMGRFGKKVNILYYLDNPSDKEIGEILKKEMDWKEPAESEYTRHFDCIAEPFTNFIREKRFGTSRRLPQLSNMIRSGEISKEEALKIILSDREMMQKANFEDVMEKLNLTESDIEEIGNIPQNVFGDVKSLSNVIFEKVRKMIKKNKH